VKHFKTSADNFIAGGEIAHVNYRGLNGKGGAAYGHSFHPVGNRSWFEKRVGPEQVAQGLIEATENIGKFQRQFREGACLRLRNTSDQMNSSQLASLRRR
jgi:hypothetical protein